VAVQPTPTPGTPPSTGLETHLIPPAVARNASEADRLQQEFIARTTGQPAPAPPGPAPAPPAPPPAPPAPVVLTPPPVALQPQPSPPPEATQEEIDLALAEVAAPGSELARWQQAYRSMIGRFNAQRERDARTIADLNALVDGQGNPPPGPQPTFQAPQIPNDEPLVTEEERTNFGDDLTAVVERIARRAAERVSKTVVGEMVAPLTRMDEQAKHDRQIRMEAGIATAMQPSGLTFEQVNTSPQFHAWLKLRDGMSGAKRHDLLRDAWGAQDGNRVLAIVGSFLDEIAPPPAPPNGAVPPAGNPPAPPGPQIQLQDLAAPGRASHPSGPPTPGAPKPIHTRAEVNEFYELRRKKTLAYPNGQLLTQPEIDTIEAEIFAASREGRIRD